MLIIVRGLPGSGKSTFAHQYLPDWFHLEQDMMFMRDGEYRYDSRKRQEAIRWCSDILERVLAKGADVVLTTCCITEKAVNWYKDLAIKYNQPCDVVVCYGEFGTRHNVPKDVLESMASDWEWYPGEIPVCDYIKLRGLRSRYKRVIRKS